MSLVPIRESMAVLRHLGIGTDGVLIQNDFTGRSTSFHVVEVV